MVILGLSTWFCTTGLMDVNDQFFLQAGLMETSPLHRGNTSIFDPTLQFGTFMYVKRRLLLFIGAHLVYGSERSGFSCMSAPLQHFMKDWKETRLWVFGHCLAKSYIFSANVIKRLQVGCFEDRLVHLLYEDGTIIIDLTFFSVLSL